MKKVLGCLVVFLVTIFTTNLFAVETTIKKINTEKKTVIIKGTEADGFVKDNKVCFYNPANSKKVACGTIRKNGKVSSLVSLAPKAITRIAKNFIVSTSQEKVLGLTVANNTNKDGLGGDVQLSKDGSSETIVVSPFRIELSYTYRFIPVKAHSLGYQKIIDSDLTNSKDSLWNGTDTMNQSPFSIASTFMYHINKLFSVSLGLNYSFLYPTRVFSDYNDSHKNKDTTYLTTKGSASIFGVFSDFTAYRYYLGPNNSNFYASVGLAFEMFSLSVDIKKRLKINEVEGEELHFADIDAKLNLFEFRFGTGYEFYKKDNLGFILGVVTTVPVTGSPSYSGTVNDEEHASYLKEGIDPTKDVYNTLNVKRTVGVDISLSSFVQF